MPFPVLSTYRLQMRGDCVHLRRRRGPAALPRRSRCLTPVPVPHPDRDDRLHARVRRHRSNHGVGGTRRRRRAGPAVGGGALTRHGPDRRHRAQPRRRRRPAAERVVVGRAATRPRLGVLRRTSTSTGRWTDGRIVLPVLGSDDDVDDLVVDGDVLRLGDLAYPIAPGTGAGTGREVHDRQHYRADRLAQRRLRLPAVLLDHLAGRAAPGGPRRLRRHPRRGQALVRRRTGRRGPHRPPGRTVRPGRLSDLAARDHRAATHGSSSRRSSPSTNRWTRACPSRAPPATTRCARSAACSSIPPASGRSPTSSTPPAPTTTRCRSWPATLKVDAVTDTLRSELGRLCRAIAAATGSRRTPSCAEAVAELLEPRRRVPVGLPEPGVGAARSRWPKPPPRDRIWPSRLRSSRRPSAPAARRLCACSSCAARRRRSRWRTACSTATRGWCRSTRSAANPTGSG